MGAPQRRPPAVGQSLQGVDPDTSLAVPQLGERRCGERNLGERWRPLVDEPLQPPQRGAFGVLRIRSGDQSFASSQFGPITATSASIVSISPSILSTKSSPSPILSMSMNTS